MLEQFAYCPTLHARVAEIKALAQLPAATKDRLFPLIIARPWPNAKNLARTWEKIAEAMGNRRFALDLDPIKRNSGGKLATAAEFDELFVSRNGFANYYEKVASIAEAIPVLRINGGEAVQFEAQARHVENLDRGLVVRIEYGVVTNPIALVEQVLDRFQDVSFFVDAGWSRDILGREAWASGIVARVARDHPEIELVISGSSFPDSFSDIADRGTNPVGERYLYNNLVRRHNSATLVYGDWGSTRPPSVDQVPMRNIPRIDLPKQSEWVSFRRDKELDDDEDYTDIAQRVVSDVDWPAGLDIWGTYTIEWTASGEPGAIRSPSTAAAARINIHLHRQAFFGANDTMVDGDEPFTDD
ncbi:beta family protein [Sphingobium sp. PNB]|uniref:beta family protein n=1 Tax=Sphingobium sp. PNB TaxID=863934 RepID=UPI001CA46140|nr:beta family protein [Sphingobium sp. PNB]MCB4859526.1 beta family protein [Sphingobium sp. PNB]